MDKKYTLTTLIEREAVLKERYRNAVNCVNDQGLVIPPGTAAAIRTNTKRDLRLVKAFIAIISQVKATELVMDEEAERGMEQLMEPVERHRRLPNEYERMVAACSHTNT